MHENSLRLMSKFIDSYLVPSESEHLKILDVGSMNVNGTYKSLFQSFDKWEYYGLDIEPGPNVDLVVRDMEWTNIDSNTYDVVISGQCLEHVEDPFMVVKQMVRVATPHSLFCIIVPWKLGVHKYPIDCWRILPDGMNALFKFNGIVPVKLEISENDTIGIGMKS